jgi:methylated-DNA-[protein]-cysteine S-methyltransferase
MADEPIFHTETESPLGPILLAGSYRGLHHLVFQQGNHPLAPPADWRPAREPFIEVIRQLEIYFTGSLRAFEIPLRPAGTDFQKTVWAALRQIPYGQTTSYGELAQAIGKPTAARAVGAATGKNPLPILVPCHRVVGKDGQLTGFSAGLRYKEALLRLEARSSGLSNGADIDPQIASSAPDDNPSSTT